MASQTKIEPRTLKGFRDFLPSDMRIRQHVMGIIRSVFEKYGYEPLETPTLEYDDILTGKYGEDEKLMYRFVDHGGRAVAMKYDLTVPAARVIAQYAHQLPLPFKRYQMQPVWRADNTQRGRYRELWQCDADTFGSNSVSIEAEWLCMGIEVFTALGLTNIAAMVNNRKLLDVILKEIINCNEEEYIPIAICLDKLDKMSWNQVKSEMAERGVRSTVIEAVAQTFTNVGSSEENINHFEQVVKNNEKGKNAIEEIKNIFTFIKKSGLDNKYVKFNPLIIRGLAYYTGVVWEWQWLSGGIGSLGGGGRYDNLIGQFIGRDVPAAGGSFGLERIIDVMKDVQQSQPAKNTTVLVTNFDPQTTEDNIEIAARLRKAGYSALYYPETSKLEKQLKYADQKDMALVIIHGSTEREKGTIIIKNFKTHTQIEVELSKLISAVAEQLQKD